MTLYDLAYRLLGEAEIAGDKDNPFVRWCHASTTMGEMPDEIAWCSSFVSRLTWLLRLECTHNAAARSWLTVGEPVTLEQAYPGNDIVIFKRGAEPQPGPEVTSGASGHVAVFAGIEGDSVLSLGGNQSNRVSIARYPVARLLGIRRLRPA